MDNKIVTFTISSDTASYHDAGLASGSLTLQANNAESAQKALALLRAVAPAFERPTLTSTIQIGELSTTYKIADAAPDMVLRWIDEMAAPMAGPPAAPAGGAK